MNTLSLKEAQYTPKVVLNKTDGIFEISGKSLPEDADDFYEPVVTWFKQYVQEPNATTVLTICFQYFNSATAKIIYNLIHNLQDVAGASIEWCYHEDDEDILDAGHEFEAELSIPFTFKEV